MNDPAARGKVHDADPGVDRAALFAAVPHQAANARQDHSAPAAPWMPMPAAVRRLMSRTRHGTRV
ncbi:hypothetical protein [Streptacidiphilus carbonis]|uniref:hypothetical protein n=1 Tax=Streptacidiphilus carbonis TaxID=105422 RepID=UPI0005AAB6CE|nr:hypothetical protein [Streptacidiphilus carbonis]